MGMSAPAGAYGAPPGVRVAVRAADGRSVGRHHSSEALMQMLQHQTSMTKWQAMLAEQNASSTEALKCSCRSRPSSRRSAASAELAVGCGRAPSGGAGQPRRRGRRGGGASRVAAEGVPAPCQEDQAQINPLPQGRPDLRHRPLAANPASPCSPNDQKTAMRTRDSAAVRSSTPSPRPSPSSALPPPRTSDVLRRGRAAAARRLHGASCADNLKAMLGEEIGVKQHEPLHLFGRRSGRKRGRRVEERVEENGNASAARAAGAGAPQRVLTRSSAFEAPSAALDADRRHLAHGCRRCRTLLTRGADADDRRPHRASTSTTLSRRRSRWRHGHRAVDTSAYASFDSIGAVLEKFPRDSYFLTSKVTHASTAQCRQEGRSARDAGGCAELVSVVTNVATLRTSHIDLMLLHRTPHRVRDDPKAQCAMLRGLWRGLEAARSAGHARAIGVSNCCGSCMRCLLETPGATVPAVWQQMHHVGMGDDPYGYISWARSKGIVYMAYSVLGGVMGDIGKIGASSAARPRRRRRSGPQVPEGGAAAAPLVALSLGEPSRPTSSSGTRAAGG